MKTEVDLNSDMGENFGPWRIGDGVDELIMPLISSANIATGFHAGDPVIMQRMVALAVLNKVGIGAHPGFNDLVGFGRRHLNAGPAELVSEFIYQMGALREFCRLHGAVLRHVKPHGALYMHAARDETLGRSLVTALQRLQPDLLLYCMGQSSLHRIATEMGQPTVREFYADRDYDRSGSIVFTRMVSALDPQAVASKVVQACRNGVVLTVEGEILPIEFDSICIHSDTPGALSLVQATRAALLENGIAIVQPAVQVRRGGERPSG